MKIIALQIDLARQKESVTFVKEYVDFAKQNGYNTIFLYLEASVRTSLTSFFDENQSYSMEEMADIVNYITSLGMQAVPSFENLYHMEKFFQYDQLAHLAEFSDATKQGRCWAPAHYKRGSVGCVSNEQLHDFMDSYITEIVSLFPGDYVHMGLDEIFELADCPVCQKRIAEGNSKENLFLQHVLHCYELCKKLGKRMMMWSDFFEYYYIVEKLPRDIVLCHWEYGFVAEEPKGHWTNRVKRDWLRIFDELGFEYMVCNWTTGASTILNLDSLNNYANKFNPMGRLFTTWERESRFYQGNYPCIAFAGQLWSGKVSNTMQDKIKVYSSFFGGNEEFAKLVLTIQVKEGYNGYFDVAKIAETPYAVRYIYNASYRYMVEKLGEQLDKIEGDKTVATVVYNSLKEQMQFMNIVDLGNYIFDGYESGKLNVAYVNEQLDKIQAEFESIKQFENNLWQQLRPNIPSNHNAFESRWANNFAILQKIRNDLCPDCGILYLDLMVPDCYSSIKGEVFVQYQGEEPISVHKGYIKPSINIFELGGGYGFRIAIQNKKVQSVIFDVYGEGALYPLHFHVLTNGKKYHPKSVQKLYGEVQNEHKVLLPDTTFASLGYERGIDHLNDGNLWAKRSGIKIDF